MNSVVQERLDQAFTGLVWLVVLAAAICAFKVILALVMKRRVNPGLLPGLSEQDHGTFFPRVVALIGHSATPQQTFGLTRLQTTLGLRLVAWCGVVVIALLHNSMNAPRFGLESLILALVALNAVQVTLYEIAHDGAEVVLPRWWFSRTTHRWRDLVAITSREPWLMTLHFADGQKVRVHKYIVGYAQFMAVAEDAVRNS